MDSKGIRVICKNCNRPGNAEEFVLDNYYDSKYSPRAYYRVAECLLKMKKYSKALEAFQKVVDKFPRNDLAGKAREQIKSLQETVKDS